MGGIIQPPFNFNSIRHLVPPKLRTVSARCFPGGNVASGGGTTAGSNDSAIVRQSFISPKSDLCGVCVDFANWLIAANLPAAAGGNDLAITASVEYPLGTIIGPLTFNGSTIGINKAGQTLRSDVLPCYIPKNSRAFIRIHLAVSGVTNGTWPGSLQIISSPTPLYNEVMKYGIGLADNTQLPSDTYAGYGLAASYGAFGIHGFMTDPVASPALLGDSLIAGSGDSANGLAPYAGDGIGNFGPYQRAINASGLVNYLRVCKSGMLARDWCSSGSLTHVNLEWRKSLDAVTTLFVQVGTNDLGLNYTSGQIIAFLKDIYAAAFARGIVVIPCTLPPRTISAVNTSPFLPSVNTNAFQPGGSSDRALVNAFIRSAPSLFPNYIPGIVEAADAVETGRDSNLWKTVGNDLTTSDGTHWNQVAGIPLVQAEVAKVLGWVR